MASQLHILLVEDDPEIARLVRAALEQAGYRTTHLGHGRTLREAMAADPPDLVLLDLMLPGEGGLSLARRIRQGGATPIIMLTALGEESDRVTGLDMGADDYIAKPFSTRELLARIRSVLRRARAHPGQPSHGPSSAPADIIRFDGWTLNARRRELMSPDLSRIVLTPAEFDLLLIFCGHPGEVMGRDRLARLAWGREVEPYDRSLDTLVSRLRRKIEANPVDPTLIKTVRHGGYVFVPHLTEIES